MALVFLDVSHTMILVLRCRFYAVTKEQPDFEWLFFLGCSCYFARALIYKLRGSCTTLDEDEHWRTLLCMRSTHTQLGAQQLPRYLADLSPSCAMTNTCNLDKVLYRVIPNTKGINTLAPEYSKHRKANVAEIETLDILE